MIGGGGIAIEFAPLRFILHEYLKIVQRLPLLVDTDGM